MLPQSLQTSRVSKTLQTKTQAGNASPQLPGSPTTSTSTSSLYSKVSWKKHQSPMYVCSLLPFGTSASDSVDYSRLLEKSLSLFFYFYDIPLLLFLLLPPSISINLVFQTHLLLKMLVTFRCRHQFSSPFSHINSHDIITTNKHTALLSTSKSLLNCRFLNKPPTKRCFLAVP